MPLAESTASFTYQARPARVVFGAGSLGRVAEEVDALGLRRVLVLCTPQQRALAEQVAGLLGERAAGICDTAAMHVPAEIADAACALAQRCGADGTVAVGGGSTIGLAKAIALQTGLPIVAIPTTYAGSEMTAIYGLTAAGLKKTGTEARVLPRAVVYDPELTYGLPVAVSVTSGLNAMAHAAEGLYAKDANPITSLMAQEGMAALAHALPRIHRDGSDAGARAQALYGAWLCGTVLGSVGMALHHKLCHTLGGSFNLPHAETHAVVLPHALAYNSSHAPVAMVRIAQALGTADAALGMRALAEATGAPLSLRELGMHEADLDRAVDIALQNAYWNPRPLEREALRGLLQRTWAGEPPA